MKRKHHNIPGQPIVSREKGEHFFCLECSKEYRKCKCDVYMSADTLKREMPPCFGAGTGNVKDLKDLFPRASQAFLDQNAEIMRVLNDTNEPQKGQKLEKLLSNETPNLRKVSNSKPQHHKTPALDRATTGKTDSLRRVRVRFTGYRVRCLDPDNFAGSCKDLLDGLRHAGLIPGDEHWRIIFETAQEKVATYSQEITLIEIET